MSEIALTTRLASLGPLGQHIDTICDPRVGIVNDVREVPVEPGSPRFFHYAARACNTSAFSPQRNFHQTGGAATTRETALAKAVGEGVERYCGALYDRDRLVLTSANDAPFACAEGCLASVSLVRGGRRKLPAFTVETATGDRVRPRKVAADRVDFHIPASGRVTIRWADKT